MFKFTCFIAVVSSSVLDLQNHLVAKPFFGRAKHLSLKYKEKEFPVDRALPFQVI